MNCEDEEEASAAVASPVDVSCKTLSEEGACGKVLGPAKRCRTPFPTADLASATWEFDEVEGGLSTGGIDGVDCVWTIRLRPCRIPLATGTFTRFSGATDERCNIPARTGLTGDVPVSGSSRVPVLSLFFEFLSLAVVALVLRCKP